MKVLVTGGRGQLGRAVLRQGQRASHEVVAVDVDRLDIRDSVAVKSMLASCAPDVVINAAAYTAVDKAESERDLAFSVNAVGAAQLAQTCEGGGVPLIHVSTDYVFDGNAAEPYREDAPLAPLGVYGESKAAGESAVRATGGRVVRTSWLFEEGGPSFVHTIVRLARERRTLRVVSDQIGCPTWADDLATALLRLAEQPTRDAIYHFCNEGVTSWHGFATEIVKRARLHTEILCEAVDAISTAEYPTPARRPKYSVLDTTKIRADGIVPPPWTIGLDHVVAEILR